MFHGKGIPQGVPDYDYDNQTPFQGRIPIRRPEGQQARGADDYSRPDRQRAPVPGRQALPSQQRSSQQALRKLPPASIQANQSSRRGPGVPMSQSPQWPLADGSVPPQAFPSPRRGPPPQRPARPNYVPPMIDTLKAASNKASLPQVIPQYRQEPTSRTANQSYQGPGVWTEDGYTSPTFPSPNPSRPVTGSSQASTSSSYSAPDVPVPQLPQSFPSPVQQQRARPPLGPPPSARRGPSSYYSQTVYVPPIIEETDSQRGSTKGSFRGAHNSQSSYASSNAIPIGIPDYYLDENRATGNDTDMTGSEDESPIEGRSRGISSQLQDRGDSPNSDLVRQASLGKRSKPTLTTIKSGDGLRQDNIASNKRNEVPQQPTLKMLQAAEAAAITKGALMARPGPQPTQAVSQQLTESRTPVSNHTGSSGTIGRTNTSFFASSPSGSEKSSLAKKPSMEYVQRKPSKEYHDYLRSRPSTESMQSKPSKEYGSEEYGDLSDRPRVPRISNDDPRVESVIGRLEKGGMLPVGSQSEKQQEKQQEQRGGLAARIGARRPPRLNVDAVRDAEARGSLTSLPDLIRRATKLASNLDRGRTASRLGWFDEAAGEKRASHVSQDNRRSGSISDILNAFPPPALLTPGSRGSTGKFWQNNLRHSALPSESDAGDARAARRGNKKKKRVCGMPLWVFLLLLLLLILLIAAAIVVPVVLIVIPRQSRSAAKSLASCQTKLACQNGGTNILGSDGTCRCLCSNGFTGATCTTASGAGCTTTRTNEANNATVGDAIPRLITGAETNFSVPLHSTAILNLFTTTNLSCVSENALVTFNGLAARSLVDDLELAEILSEPSVTVDRRQATPTSAGNAATSAGIIYATGSPSSSASPSSGSTSGSSSSNSSTTSANSTTLDFARIAVLFVLQDSSQLNDAIMAQEALQSYFTDGTTSSGQAINAANMSLSNGYTVNLDKHFIVVGNGTIVGRNT